MLDNGAFSAWRIGKPTNWPGYYDFCDRWLEYPTTWAVIPDVIDAPSQEQDGLLNEWPFGFRGAPVWHLDEPVVRLLRLAEKWPRICFGSTAQYSKVGSPVWVRKVDEAFEALSSRHRHLPWVHMLRGMQCCEWQFPFASVDSTDVAQNHSKRGPARMMADKWDAQQCPGTYAKQPIQMMLEVG